MVFRHSMKVWVLIFLLFKVIFYKHTWPVMHVTNTGVHFTEKSEWRVYHVYDGDHEPISPLVLFYREAGYGQDNVPTHVQTIRLDSR